LQKTPKKFKKALKKLQESSEVQLISHEKKIVKKWEILEKFKKAPKKL
jgi:hypothetical protein